ncbi:MAG TPA: tRNA 2-thiouridine(34) synthase MnmA, partial [Candidatus Saccharimonadales bacterium]|nr:tRNA 2-thiouridine(34) synthase MnmA [Candidatus Saccharimonadales bacterium]
MAKKVYVGMSGGVDSSVTAALLKEQGYEVTGVYMKNWSQDLPGFACPWKEDYQDAKRVAVQLGIPFKLYDFETQYRRKVVDYMVREYRAGRTPNPDIMCNQEVKFKLFLETALEDGADLIATGHYARSRDGQLLTGLDPNKDQSYFLYRVTEEALRRSLMPVGEMEKPAVRELARKLGLATADKKDSQGICFVGKVGIKEFLLHELGPQPHGPILDQKGREIGEHDGAIFYTIGQRHGLNVGGGLPYYVSRKDMETNTVYVTTNLEDQDLWSERLTLEDMHWIDGRPAADKRYQARLRYRGPLVDCRLEGDKTLLLAEPQRGIAAGQSAV